MDDPKEENQPLVYKKDVVQVTNERHKFYACLVIVDEVKDWGVQAYMPMPMPGSSPVYLRLDHTDYMTLSAGFAYLTT